MSTRGQRRGQGELCVRTQPSLDPQKSQRPQSAAGSWGGDKKGQRASKASGSTMGAEPWRADRAPGQQPRGHWGWMFHPGSPSTVTATGKAPG